MNHREEPGPDPPGSIVKIGKAGGGRVSKYRLIGHNPARFVSSNSPFPGWG